MNKTITKTLVTGLVYLAFCGMAFAAPGRGNGSREPQKAPVQQKTPERNNGGHHNPAPANHRAPERHCAPIAHHAPPPARHEPAPPPPPAQHCEGAGWAVLGAVVGGIVGACL